MIGLLDVDSHNFPNLCQMKLSAYFKNHGESVERWNPYGKYDVVYKSKVFTESPDIDVFNANRVESGGSGYDLQNKLPYEIEHATPDYTLYPQYDFAVGFLTRGCPRCDHPFCITPEKDGHVSIKTADVTEFWTGQKQINLLDQNLLACKERLDLLGQISETKAKIQLDGGTDIRFVNDEVINAFRKCKIEDYHFAWDNPREDLRKKFELFASSDLFKKNHYKVYVLVNYWSSFEEDMFRIRTLREIGYVPYIMVYDKQKVFDNKGNMIKFARFTYDSKTLRKFKICQMLQRWCNSNIIKITDNFEDYEPYKNWKQKGMPV